jgi:beta-phosphoglucomutase
MEQIKAVIFDLDGVIVSTDEFHYQAWKKLAESEHIYFDRQINERLRGVSRMDSLNILLERSKKEYSEAEKTELATKKNNSYRKLLNNLSAADILPGVNENLADLKSNGFMLAIGSSSKNTPAILKQIGLADFFHAVSDGNQISESKPHPEVFLLAATKLHVSPENCLVVEDADAGVEAAKNGNMKVLAVDSAANHKQADFHAQDLSNFSILRLIQKKVY